MQKLNKTFNESDLKITSYNKPYFKSDTIKFNISYSGEVVVCVLTEMGNIGIDIERIQKIKAVDFKSQMTPNEWQIIQRSSNREVSFFKYWTQKEAVIKAHGNGLSIPLQSFEICDNKNND